MTESKKVGLVYNGYTEKGQAEVGLATAHSYVTPSGVELFVGVPGEVTEQEAKSLEKAEGHSFSRADAPKGADAGTPPTGANA